MIWCNRFIGLLLFAGLSFTIGAQTEPSILAAMRRADSSIKNVGVLGKVQSSSDTVLILVEGSARTDDLRYSNGTYAWGPSDTLSLLSTDPNAVGNIRILKSYRHNSDDCCAVHLLRSTSSEFVLARLAEKLEIRPNLKLLIDSKTVAVTTLEYMPFSIQDVHVDSGVPTFTAGDGSQFLAIRATDTEPFLQLIAGKAAAPRPSVTAVPSALFGPRSPKLPQSTYDEFAAARPNRAADGYDRAGTEFHETIGPVQVVGTRAWFGKTFYDGEFNSGVGAFGYLDQNESKFHLFSPPEIRDWSVSALLVEDQVAWLGLASWGEGSSISGGVLRVDLQTMQVRKIPVYGITKQFARYQNRLYLSTSEGVSVILANGSIQHAFVDMNADHSYHLSATTN